MTNPTPRICDTCRHNHCKPSHYPCVECFPESRERWQERKKKKTPWISVEDKLPEFASEDSQVRNTDTVLAADRDGYRYIGYFRKYKHDGQIEFVGYDAEVMADIAECEFFDASGMRWMPLPEPPEVND